MRTSPNQAGVAEPRLKIWDKNLGQKFGTDGQTDRQTRPDIELLCNLKDGLSAFYMILFPYKNVYTTNMPFVLHFLRTNLVAVKILTFIMSVPMLTRSVQSFSFVF